MTWWLWLIAAWAGFCIAVVIRGWIANARRGRTAWDASTGGAGWMATDDTAAAMNAHLDACQIEDLEAAYALPAHIREETQ